MTAKPARRRRSSLAGQHPAIPPKAAPSTTTTSESPALAPAPAPAPERGPAPVRTREADDLRAEQARARTAARDAAYGWGAARRRLDARTRAWIASLERARALGALPGVLGDYIREGAERAGIDPTGVPVEVWRAAGLDHPEQ